MRITRTNESKGNKISSLKQRINKLKFIVSEKRNIREVTWLLTGHGIWVTFTKL